MSGIKIQIKGLAKLRKKFSVMPKHLNKELNNAVRKSVFLVEAMTKPEVPVDTGLLRGSIGTGSEGFKKFSNLRGVIGTRVEYAVYVHDGTYAGHIPEPRGTGQKGAKARPFMEKGTEKARIQIEKYFEKAVKKAISNT